MKDTESLEGWVPEIGDRVTLEEVIERAFDYRGNVTVVRADGARLEGYVFNRNRDVPVPFIQVFDRAGAGPYDIRSEEHTSELQSQSNLVCRLLLEKKKKHSYHEVLLT